MIYGWDGGRRQEMIKWGRQTRPSRGNFANCTSGPTNDRGRRREAHRVARKESATAHVVNPPNRLSTVPEFQQLVQRHDCRKLQRSGNDDAQHGHAASHATCCRLGAVAQTWPHFTYAHRWAWQRQAMDCASAKRYHAALDLPAGCSVRLPPVSVWSVVVLNFVLALHGRARVQKLGGAATFGCIARDLPDLQRGLKELHPGCVNFRGRSQGNGTNCRCRCCCRRR